MRHLRAVRGHIQGLAVLELFNYDLLARLVKVIYYILREQRRLQATILANREHHLAKLVGVRALGSPVISLPCCGGCLHL